MIYLGVWSAIINFFSAVAVLFFSVKLTHGAGFGSALALMRWIHRLSLLILSAALVNCALHQLQMKTGPSIEWFGLQVAMLICIAASVVRHLQAPAEIPPEASWRHPVETELKVR